MSILRVQISFGIGHSTVPAHDTLDIYTHLLICGTFLYHCSQPTWRLSPFSDTLFKGPMLAPKIAHRALAISTFCVAFVWLGEKLPLSSKFWNSKLHLVVTHLEHKVHMEGKE